MGGSSGFCNELLLSVEALAREMEALNLCNPSRHYYYFLPAIITTTNLQLVHINPLEVDLSNGQPADAKCNQLSWVSFTKNMESSLPPVLTNSAKAAHKANDRSVLIVNAFHFEEFLNSLYFE